MQHQCNLAAMENGLECTCVNNDDFTVLVSGDGRCCWVSMCTMWPSHSKWLSNKSASNFALSLNIPPQKLCGWFGSPQLWATGHWQLHHNNEPAHASRLVQNFVVKHQITLVTQLPYSPDLAPWDFWLFPKLKPPLKGKRFHTVDEIQENTMGQLMATSAKNFVVFWIVKEMLGELCEVPRSLLWRRLRHNCPIYNVSCILFNKCLYISYCMDEYFLDRLYMSIYISQQEISLGLKRVM